MGSQSSAIRSNGGIRPDLKKILLGLDGNLGALQGTVWYVDAVDGVDGNDGLSWERPLLTMNEAFATDRITSGDTIVFRGKVREQISTPVQVFDITVVGAANKPRHADTQPVDPDGRSHGATWTVPASPTAATPLVTVRQQGWRFVNMLFDIGTVSDACVELFRDGGAGDAERDASHASFYGCRFAGGASGTRVGIQDSGGAGHILVDDCEFAGLTTAIANTAGAGIGQPWLRSTIRNSRFRDCTTYIDLPSQELLIRDCDFFPGATTYIDLRGGVGKNVVTRNHLSGTYSNVGGYYAGTDDEWGGNFNSLTGGVTAADPA